MKRAIIWFALAALAPVQGQQPKILLTVDELLSDWKISKEFTLAVAEKMPAEHYDFKPNPEQRSFAEQMVHIGGSIVYRFQQLTGVLPPAYTLPDKPDKAAVIKFLNASFDYVIDVIPKITPEQLTKNFKVDWKGRPEVNGRQMMLNMFVHTAHHRAQCEVYLRLKNIRPPDYTF